jgi:hypothetical protein
MVTLGYRHPVTGEEWLVEVTPPIPDRNGARWANRLDPDTREQIGSMFVAEAADLF